MTIPLTEYADIMSWRVHAIDATAYFGESAMGVCGDLDSMHANYAGTLVQIYDECQAPLLLDSPNCDCGTFLARSRDQIIAAGAGILFSLKGGEMFQIAGHDQNKSPFERERYEPCARFLVALNINRIRLMTSDSIKVKSLQSYGLEIVPADQQ